MNLLRLSWKNLTYKPLTGLLSVLLFALSIGLISLLLNLRAQADEQFDANLAGINLVVGAKGSPLELTLNSMYHVGYPTGNVSLGEVKAFFNPAHPIVAAAVPLSVGDAYRGYRIVGTTPELLEWYGARVGKGQTWRNDFEAVIGADVAAATGLGLGDVFRSSHGIIDEGEDNNIEHDDDFRVVGILEPSGTVMDQLLLTTNQTYWHSHGDHEHDDEEHDYDHAEEDHEHAEAEHDHDHGEESHDHAEEVHDHDHGNEAHEHAEAEHNHDHGEESHDHAEEVHDHDHGNEAHDHAEGEHDHERSTGEEAPGPGPGSLLQADPEREITSLLVKYRNPTSFQALNFARNINENTELLAANPAYEISEVRRRFDSGQRILGILVLAITVVSALSIFISLFTSLRERRYELALLRTFGAGRGRVFGLIILEGLLVAVTGYALGMLLSHGILALLAANVQDDFRYTLSPLRFLAAEGWLLLVALGIAFLAALLPAVRAANTDIGETLAGEG